MSETKQTTPSTPINYAAAFVANSLYKDYCQEVICNEKNKSIPEPLHKALCDLAHRRYELRCVGNYEVMLNPEPEKTRNIEGYIKATLGMLDALALTYPEYKETLSFDKTNILNLFNEAKRLGNNTKQTKRIDDLKTNLDSLRILTNKANDEILTILKNMDNTFGTQYMPSRDFLLAEAQVPQYVRSALIDKAERSATDNIFPKATISELKEFVNKERKHINRHAMLGIQKAQVENTTLSDESKRMLLNLCCNRHNFHAGDFVDLFINPENENIDSVNSLIECWCYVNSNDNLPSLEFDVAECFNEMRQIAIDAKEDNWSEEHLENYFEAFHNKKEELDAIISVYLASVDDMYNLNLTPEGLSREGQDLYTRSFKNIKKNIKKEQNRQIKNKEKNDLTK